MKYGKPSVWDKLKRASRRILRSLRPITYANWKRYVGKTYVLNLKHRVDRKQKLTQHLKLVKTSRTSSLADEVTWFPATEKLSNFPKDIHIPKYPFSYHWLLDPDRSFLKKFDYYLEQEIECSQAESNIAVGHIKMWRDFVASKKETALFIEDDVLFEHDFEVRFNKIMKKELPKDWDMLYFSCLPSKNGFKWDPHSEHLAKLHQGAWWMSGYMLTRAGAKKLLKCLPIIGPVDVWINHQFDYVNAYMCKWNLIDQGGDDISNNTYSFEHRFWGYNE